MDNLFSTEMIELVSKSREMAIDLGYNYISTIHFFLADCENKNAGSIFRFGFNNYNEFEKFKKDYTLQKTDLLNLIDESLPLTKEAEKAIWLADAERIIQKQELIYPGHFFIAALKNDETVLFKCFAKTENPAEQLTKYYDGVKIFKTPEMMETDTALQEQNSVSDKKPGLFQNIVRLFNRQK